MTLTELLIELERRLSALEVPHAFGGAIALAFYTREPRATRDVDCNILMPVDQIDVPVEALRGLVAFTQNDLDRLRSNGQVRVMSEGTPIDLFFNTDPYHDQILGRSRTVDFVGESIRVLSAHDLAVFKIMFNRRKDWADIEQMAFDADVDWAGVKHDIIALLGDDDARVMELDRVLRDVANQKANEQL